MIIVIRSLTRLTLETSIHQRALMINEPFASKPVALVKVVNDLDDAGMNLTQVIG